MRFFIGDLMETKKTGTTTVGLVAKDGVILASDKRATMGHMIASKDVDKVYAISDYIAMTVAGSVGDAQKLVRLMKAELKLYKFREGKEPSPQVAANLLANILSSYKMFPFFVQLLIGGYDPNTDRKEVYSVDMLGGVTKENMTSTGSGSPFAYGVLEELYKPNKSIKENLKVAVKAIKAAMKRDCASGEGINLFVIDKNGVKKLKKEEIKKLL